MHFLQNTSLLYRHRSIDCNQMSPAADISLVRCLRGLCLAILTGCMVAVYVYDLVLRPLGHAVAAWGSGWGSLGVWCLAFVQPGWSTTAAVVAAAAVLYVWRSFEVSHGLCWVSTFELAAWLAWVDASICCGVAWSGSMLPASLIEAVWFCAAALRARECGPCLQCLLPLSESDANIALRMLQLFPLCRIKYDPSFGGFSSSRAVLKHAFVACTSMQALHLI